MCLCVRALTDAWRQVLETADEAAAHRIEDVLIPLPGTAVMLPTNFVGDAIRAQLIKDGGMNWFAVFVGSIALTNLFFVFFCLYSAAGELGRSGAPLSSEGRLSARAMSPEEYRASSAAL